MAHYKDVESLAACSTTRRRVLTVGSEFPGIRARCPGWSIASRMLQRSAQHRRGEYPSRATGVSSLPRYCSELARRSRNDYRDG